MNSDSCKTQADIDREDRAFRREVDEYLAENDLQAVPVGAVVIDPEDREQVQRFVAAFVSEARVRGHYVNGEHTARVQATQAALRSLIAPPKCKAILNVKGEHVDCDRGEGHSLPHGNVEHGAIWQGVTS